MHQPSAPHDPEASPLIGSNNDPDPIFRKALDSELEKISSFYQLKELEIYGEVDALLRDAEEYVADADGVEHEQTEGPPGSRGMNKSGRARQGSILQNMGFGRPRRTSTLSASMGEVDEEADSDDEGDETTALNGSTIKRRGKGHDSHSKHSIDDMRSSRELPSHKRRTSQAFEDYSDQAFAVLYDSGITLKKRTIGLYVSLCELKSFIQLNKTGFSKALKKYDKILNRNLRSRYIDEQVKPAHPFKDDTMQHLDEKISKIEKVYADVVTKGDVSVARRELRLHLREHVVWERNTVWREMIGIERKAQAANMGLRRTLLGVDNDPSKAQLQGDEPELATKELVTPLGKVSCPTWLFSSSFFTLLAIIAVFAVLLTVPIMKKAEQQNCLAMLVFVSLLWATEVIPLFVTSLLIPFLVVVLQIARSEEKPYHRLKPKDATKFVFSAMWTPVIMLLLGGFTIAAALSKYHIAKLMATWVLSKAGTKPRTVLLTNMFVAMIASMWISNVAAPVLCFSIVQVCLRYWVI
jgi:phosphate transporter